MPVGRWWEVDYDALNWKEGFAPFSSKDTPGIAFGTNWNNTDIWIRQEFEVENTDFNDIRLYIYHDEDAEVFINGVPAAKLRGYTTTYKTVFIEKEALKSLKKGKNTIAIHCMQTAGGQGIDAGLKIIIPVNKK